MTRLVPIWGSITYVVSWGLISEEVWGIIDFICSSPAWLILFQDTWPHTPTFLINEARIPYTRNRSQNSGNTFQDISLSYYLHHHPPTHPLLFSPFSPPVTLSSPFLVSAPFLLFLFILTLRPKAILPQCFSQEQHWLEKWAISAPLFSARLRNFFSFEPLCWENESRRW